MDVSLYDVQGVHAAKPSKYSPISTLRWIGGLQTQRSVFAALDSRYNQRYLGGKPDALIAGSNCEINNKLTLQRRPGLVAYGTSNIPAPDFFYSWQQASLANFVSIVDPTQTTYPNANLQLIVDTATNGTNAPGSIYNYSSTKAGIILNKSVLSQQTSFETVVNTMYLGDGVDLYKQVGANLLTYSNTFGNAVWTSTNVTLATGQTDPTGSKNATQFTISSSGSGTYLFQTSGTFAPNYTPVASNTFTFSVWLKAASTQNVSLFINDQTNSTVVQSSFSLTTSWALYQITGTTSGSVTAFKVGVFDPTTTATTYAYGAQFEVGGPATPTTITLNKPNGIYLWGIQAPQSAPTFTFQQQLGSTGQPWEPGTAYSQTTASITAVAATALLGTPVTINGVTYSSGAIYTATVSGGAANGLQGRYFSCLNGSNGTLATANQSTAPGFLCLLSSATTITLYNTAATAQGSLSGTVTATLLDTIVDSNGNLEVAYTPGTSGGTAPVWNPTQTQSTSDSALVVQANSNQANSATCSTPFVANVAANNTKLVFVACSNSPSSGTPSTPTLTDSSGDTLTLFAHKSVSNIAIFLFYKLSATAGASAISTTNGGNQATWIGVAEIDHQTATDGSATNSAQMSTNIVFSTGSVTPTNTPDILITYALFAVPNSTQGNSQGKIPDNFQGIIAQAPTTQGTGVWNMAAAYQFENTTSAVNPTWTITNPTTNSNDGYMGLSAAFKSSVGTLVWYNIGPKGLTSTSVTNYQYAYSFVNSYTGHRSNISPFSTTTGTFAGQAITVTGSGLPTSTDSQVDAIEVYRNVDGGAIWHQIPPSLMTSMSGTLTDANGNLYLANPGTAASAGTWSFTDTVQDAYLNTQIYAPMDLLNSTPPAGLTNLTFWSGRMWGSVGNLLYYATGPDNAVLLNLLQNGVPSESWYPSNVIPFDSEIVRSVPAGNGLLVFTTTDIWLVQGSNAVQYAPITIASNIGLGNYNALCVDGSNIMLITRDRECLWFSLSSGFYEIGFVIGDKIESTINPLTAYLTRHVKGSQDNAYYVGDGATGWFRLNPNQYGASASGEQAPIWSPFATITGGCNALASIEVQPGIKLLLVGAASGTGPILNRDITVFTDNGTAYTWSATIGSVILALPSVLAAVESVTTEMVASNSTQCRVGVLLDEISGTFETLPATNPQATNDPPQLNPSTTVLATRFFLSPGTSPPVCRHLQVQLSGTTVGTQDEILSLTLRGEILNESE